MSGLANNKNRGFTLVETILASIIICGVVLAVGAISTRSLGQARLNRQYEAAMALADRQLTLIDYIGIEDFIESDQMQGNSDKADPTYHWQIVTTQQEIDSLYLVNIEVSWIERSRNYSISVDTMLNAAGSATEIVQR